jgi:hypothetical protein
MDREKPKDWRQLSEAASREHDPKRLMELIDELKRVLEDEYAQPAGRAVREQAACEMIRPSDRLPVRPPLPPYFA